MRVLAETLCPLRGPFFKQLRAGVGPDRDGQHGSGESLVACARAAQGLQNHSELVMKRRPINYALYWGTSA